MNAVATLRREFAQVVSYFSIFPPPWPRSSDGTLPDLAFPDRNALRFLPLLGGMIGVLAGLLGVIAHLFLSSFVSAVVIFATVMMCSGAIHFDGFLDACDGLLATASPERRREIAKDPHHGTYAFVGGAIACLLWIGALSMLIGTPGVHGLRLIAIISILGILGRLACIRAAGSSTAVLICWSIVLAILTPWVLFREHHERHSFVYTTINHAGREFGFRATQVEPHLRHSAVMPTPFEAVLGLLTAIVIISVALVIGDVVAGFGRRRLGGKESGDVFGTAAICAEVAITVITAAALNAG